MAAITTAAAVTAAIGVAGVGAQVYGLVKSQEASEEASRGNELKTAGAKMQAEGAEIQSQGSLQQVEGAKVQNAASKEITKLELKAEEQRFRAMEVDSKRKQLEVVRNQQRARALGLATATAQGASKGSALSGAYGQVSGQSGVNMLGIQQNLELGRNIFNINSGISSQKLAYAAGGDIINEGAGTIARGQGVISKGAGLIAEGGGIVSSAQGTAQLASGISQFGGSLVSSSQTLGNVASTTANIFSGFGSSALKS